MVPLRPKTFSVRVIGTAPSNQGTLGSQIEQTMDYSLQAQLNFWKFEHGIMDLPCKPLVQGKSRVHLILRHRPKALIKQPQNNISISTGERNMIFNAPGR
jgi:hypothetical protein